MSCVPHHAGHILQGGPEGEDISIPRPTIKASHSEKLETLISTVVITLRLTVLEFFFFFEIMP
jgi:hypothetical protein